MDWQSSLSCIGFAYRFLESVMCSRHACFNLPMLFKVCRLLPFAGLRRKEAYLAGSISNRFHASLMKRSWWRRRGLAKVFPERWSWTLVMLRNAIKLDERTFIVTMNYLLLGKSTIVILKCICVHVFENLDVIDHGGKPKCNERGIERILRSILEVERFVYAS